MPVIRDIPLSLKTAEVLRRQGLRKGAKVRPEIRILIRELLADVMNSRLLERAAAYEIYAVADITEQKLFMDNGPASHDSLLHSLLSGAKKMAIAVYTIGPGLEKQVTEDTNYGEPLWGMLLDGIGSAAVDSLAEEVCRFIADEASSRGYQASSPVNSAMPVCRLLLSGG